MKTDRAAASVNNEAGEGLACVLGMLIKRGRFERSPCRTHACTGLFGQSAAPQLIASQKQKHSPKHPCFVALSCPGCLHLMGQHAFTAHMDWNIKLLCTETGFVHRLWFPARQYMALFAQVKLTSLGSVLLPQKFPFHHHQLVTWRSHISSA